MMMKGRKSLEEQWWGSGNCVFLKKESESDLTISLQLSDWEQTEKEKKKKGIKTQEKEEEKNVQLTWTPLHDDVTWNN